MGSLSHTVGGTDNLVSFKSAARVPIDSLKVHFKPIQEGEGDPSPENIRPIKGWNEIDIYRDGDKKTRQVTWNQWCKPLTEDNWKAYNTANNDVQFENGIATSTWLQNKSGYSAAIVTKVGIRQKNKEVWYVSYMLKSSIPNLSWGVEYNGGYQITCIGSAEADIWTQCSNLNLYYRGTSNNIYIGYCRAATSSNDLTGLVAQVKAPLHINLTQMFGYGNEPTKEEFEAQCLLNGVNLTTALPYDEGHIIEWKTDTTNIKYTVPVSVPEKNLFNVNAPFAEPSNTDQGNDSTLRAFQPYTYCLGLSLSNIYRPTSITSFSCANEVLSFTATNTTIGVAYAIPLVYGSYRISYTVDNVRVSIAFYDEYGQQISYTSNANFTVPKEADMTVVIFIAQKTNTTVSASNIQIEEGINATEYKAFDPDNGIYGGYVDLIKGEVVQEYDIYTFTGDEKDGFIYTDTKSLSNDEVSERHIFNTTILDNIAKRNSTSDAYCNIGAPNLYSLGRKGSIIYYIGIPSKQISLSIDSSLCEPTIESFSQWLSEHPLRLVYKLATPVTYPLAPTQLAAFINVNNIWSNTNDVTEVSYAIHDSALIRDAKKRMSMAFRHTKHDDDDPLVEE